MLSCFVNSIFNSFVISYWMYFACDRKKKKLKEKKLYILLKMQNKIICKYPQINTRKTLYANTSYNKNLDPETKNIGSTQTEPRTQQIENEDPYAAFSR